jgi:hypothetical protein
VKRVARARFRSASGRDRDAPLSLLLRQAGEVIEDFGDRHARRVEGEDMVNGDPIDPGGRAGID